MSYKLKNLLSDVQYEQIMNSTDENIVSLFSSILEKEENDISNENLIQIRTLSKNEYNKHIITGTCDGAITSNNVNVYHHPESVFHKGYRTGNYNGSWWNSTYYSYNDSQYVNDNTTVTLNAEIISNNTLNKSIYDKDILVEFSLTDTNPYLSYSYNHAILNKASHEFTKNQYNTTYTLYTYVAVRQNITKAVTMYINMQLCFRPVFSYIDNKKSINAFS